MRELGFPPRAMAKPLCILHANCQGQPLAWLLTRHYPFRERYDLVHVVNYTRRPIPEEALARCSLLLHQHLDAARWGELSSEAMRARLPRNAHALCIPNFFTKAYWPFWERSTTIEFSDELLNAVQDRAPNDDAALALAVDRDITRLSLGREARQRAEDSLAHELEKARRWEVGAALAQTIVEEHVREPLFRTVNHPGDRLMRAMAAALLDALALPPAPAALLAAMPAIDPMFELPIHPQAAALLGLQWLHPEARFRVYGARMTYREYAAHYLRCRRLGVEALAAYLQLQTGYTEAMEPEESLALKESDQDADAPPASHAP